MANESNEWEDLSSPPLTNPEELLAFQAAEEGVAAKSAYPLSTSFPCLA